VTTAPAAGSFRRPPTAQEAVLVELRRAMVRGELQPGEQIVQETLAERFGVSRVPLREALKILEGEGAVTYVARRGYFVADLSMDDLLEVYRIRAVLEAEAVRVGVPLLTDDDRAQFVGLVERWERAAVAGDLLDLAAANRALHFTLIEAARMPRLTRLVRILWDATDVYRSVYYGAAASLEAVAREHRQILAAVLAGDADEVVRLLDDHRDGAVEHVRATLSGRRTAR